MNGFDWDDIRYFLAAAQHGSLSAAARVLAANQPTVGRRISSLENRLGLKLFQRHAQGLTLTEDGERILRAAETMAESALKVHHIANGETVGLSGSVRIAAPEGLGVLLITPALQRFRSHYPHIRYSLEASARPADMLHGESDVAVRLFRPTAPDLVVRQLGFLPLSFYASATYVAQYGQPQDMADLNGHQLIAYGDSLRHMEENQWMEQQFPDSRIIFTSDSTLSRLAAIESGLGIGLLPDCLAYQRSELIRLDLAMEIPRQEVWLVVHKDLRSIERIRLMMNFILELFARHPAIQTTDRA